MIQCSGKLTAKSVGSGCNFVLYTIESGYIQLQYMYIYRCTCCTVKIVHLTVKVGRWLLYRRQEDFIKTEHRP